MWHDFIIRVSFESCLTDVKILNVSEWSTRQINYNTQYEEEDNVEVDPMSSEDVPGGRTRRDQTRMKPELCNQERNETKSKE